MKKIITLFAAITLFVSVTNASTPNPERRAFKETSKDVNFEVERGKGEVIFHFLSMNIENFEQIVIERSSAGGFTPCKIISLSDVNVIDGYFTSVDKFPLPAKIDCQYRLKTISKDGITKTFPPVDLQALSR